MPSLATEHTTGGGAFVPGFSGCGSGASAHGTIAEMSHDRYESSASRMVIDLTFFEAGS